MVEMCKTAFASWKARRKQMFFDEFRRGFFYWCRRDRSPTTTENRPSKSGRQKYWSTWTDDFGFARKNANKNVRNRNKKKKKNQQFKSGLGESPPTKVHLVVGPCAPPSKYRRFFDENPTDIGFVWTAVATGLRKIGCRRNYGRGRPSRRYDSEITGRDVRTEQNKKPCTTHTYVVRSVQSATGKGFRVVLLKRP